MDSLGVDPFSMGPVDYLAVVDRSSSFIKCYLMTFNSVRKALVDFFLQYDRAHKIRSDGGPSFLKQFASWTREMGIELETSSPRNSQSKGLAESGVKRCENIIVKSHLKTQSSIDEAVMCYNSKLRASGQGRPVDLFLKRRVRFLLPSVNKSGLATLEFKARRKRQLELIRLRTLKRMKHPQFQINDEVRIRDPKLGTWKQLGEIIDIEHSGAALLYF